MGNTLCGSVVVVAIPNAHTQDDATDSLSLRSFYGKNYVLLRVLARVQLKQGDFIPDYSAH